MSAYNALLRFANMRKSVVSDIPDDIDLSIFNFNEDETELILHGIPRVRDCIFSIYDNVIQYAKDKYITSAVIEKMEKKGGAMDCNRESRHYLDALFQSFLSILINSRYDSHDNTFTISKQQIFSYKNEKGKPVKFQTSMLQYFESFCRIEYYVDSETGCQKNMTAFA